LVGGSPCTRFARCVEYDADMSVRLVTHELVDHRQHAMQRASRFALGVRQIRQGVERPVQIGRAVDQYQVNAGHWAYPAY